MRIEFLTRAGRRRPAALGLAVLALLPAGGSAAAPEAPDEIVVTGSRLGQSAAVGSSPVLGIDAGEFRLQGGARAEDLLRSFPQLYLGQNSGASYEAVGTATVDLRNLGAQRTLVLVNGRRLPPGSPLARGGAADLNQIPMQLVRRVEVLTGGASAAYGSDAVAGVVNFQLRDDFEGLALDYQFGQYRHRNDSARWRGVVAAAGHPPAPGEASDGDISALALTAGFPLPDARGHVAAYFSYRHTGAVLQGDRDYSACTLDRTRSFCRGSSTIPAGRFTDFGETAQPYDFTVAGDEFVDRAPDDLYNYGRSNYFQRPDERHALGLLARLDAGARAEAYLELMFAETRTVAQIAPSGNFFLTDTLRCDHPFLSAQQYRVLCAERGLGRDDTQRVVIGRRSVESGERQNDLRHSSARAVLGLRGELGDAWRYDAFAQYAEVRMKNTFRNDLSRARIERALDAVRDPATGAAVCRAALDGTDPACVPWNIFRAGGVTPAMADYLRLSLHARGRTDQGVASAYLAGELDAYGLVSPFAGRGLAVVLGGEYREENLSYRPNAAYRAGDGAGQGGASAPVRGGFEVAEVFAELSAPLAEGRPYAEELVLDLAWRHSDYDYGETANTYAARLGWAPEPALRLRGSYQRAVRGADVRELFLPEGFALFDMPANDPCAGPVSGPPGRERTELGRSFEECARSGVTAAQWGRIENSPASQYNYLQGGSAALRPETADTWSLGLVWAPPAAAGLLLTADYYRLRLRDGIGTPSPAAILDQCLDGRRQYCAAVRRGAAGDLWVGSDVPSSGHVVARTSNDRRLDVRGVDLAAEHRLGRWEFRNVLSYVERWRLQQLPTAAARDCAGRWGGDCGAPTPALRNRLRATWRGPWGLRLSGLWRYLSRVEAATPRLADLREMDYFDLAADWAAGGGLTLRAGLNNLFDREPPNAGDAAGPTIFGNGNTFPGLYDALGQYWYLGAAWAF